MAPKWLKSNESLEKTNSIICNETIYEKNDTELQDLDFGDTPSNYCGVEHVCESSTLSLNRDSFMCNTCCTTKTKQSTKFDDQNKEKTTSIKTKTESGMSYINPVPLLTTKRRQDRPGSIIMIQWFSNKRS